jgi:hypothetical protein
MNLPFNFNLFVFLMMSKVHFHKFWRNELSHGDVF